MEIALSFVLAGVWISGATLLGEKLGSKRAGLITNLPSSILLSLIFMALTMGPEYAAATTKGIPVGMTIDTLFTFVFILMARKGLSKALTISLIVWAITAYVFIKLIPPLGMAGAIGLYVLVTALCFILAEGVLHIRSVPPNSFKGSFCRNGRGRSRDDSAICAALYDWHFSNFSSCAF